MNETLAAYIFKKQVRIYYPIIFKCLTNTSERSYASKKPFEKNFNFCYFHWISTFVRIS